MERKRNSPQMSVYHIVTFSPWPLTTTLSLQSLILGIVFQIKEIEYGKEILLLSLFSLIYSIYHWSNNIITEGSFQGEHTKNIQKGLTLGFILFVISEICVFFALFFSYFYNALVPTLEVGGLWPPIGIKAMNWRGIPLENSFILLLSGVYITISYNFFQSRSFTTKTFQSIKNSLNYTLILGLTFLLLQVVEYFNSPFTISDSVFGSSFYILTGCHGVHIVIGISLLFLSLLRLPSPLLHSSPFRTFSSFLTPFDSVSSNFLLFSFSAIYWHFLDAVWLVILLTLYIWVF